MGNTLNLAGRIYDNRGALYGAGLTMRLLDVTTAPDGDLIETAGPLTDGAWSFALKDDTKSYKVEAIAGLTSKRVIDGRAKMQLAELQVTGKTRLKGDVNIEGAATFGGGGGITGDLAITGNLGVSAALTVGTGITLTAGDLTLTNGDIVLGTAGKLVDGVDLTAFKSAYEGTSSTLSSHISTTPGLHWRDHSHNVTDGAQTQVAHANLSGLTTDNHHAKSHAHTSGDGSGTLTAYQGRFAEIGVFGMSTGDRWTPSNFTYRDVPGATLSFTAPAKGVILVYAAYGIDSGPDNNRAAMRFLANAEVWMENSIGAPEGFGWSGNWVKSMASGASYVFHMEGRTTQDDGRYVHCDYIRYVFVPTT